MTEEKTDNFGGILSRGENLVMEKSPDFIKIYANNVQIAVSLFDMSLFFGEIIGDRDGKPLVEQKVKINMSKEMTKVLTHLLVGNIQAYEKQFGEIKIPQSPKPPTKEEVILGSASRRNKK